jgi:hypothetical protein
MDLKAIIKTLFRPREGFLALSGKMAWVWVPCLVFLALALMVRVSVATPRQIVFLDAATKAANAQAQAEMQSQMGGATGEKDAVVEGADGTVTSEAGVPADGDVIVTESSGVDSSGQTIVWVSNYVFGIVGLLASILFTSLFFFVAGKVWTAGAGYRAFLSMTTLAFVPYGLRDLLQSAYMTLTNTYLQHAGLSVFAAPKDALTSGGIMYGLLGFIDVWTIWATALLYVGLRYAIGLTGKRALIAWGVFVAVVVLMRVATGAAAQLLTGGGA